MFSAHILVQLNEIQEIQSPDERVSKCFLQSQWNAGYQGLHEPKQGMRASCLFLAYRTHEGWQKRVDWRKLKKKKGSNKDHPAVWDDKDVSP